MQRLLKVLADFSVCNQAALKFDHGPQHYMFNSATGTLFMANYFYTALLLVLLQSAAPIAHSRVTLLYPCISTEVSNQQECRLKAFLDPQLNIMMANWRGKILLEAIIPREQTLTKILTEAVDFFQNNNNTFIIVYVNLNSSVSYQPY